MQETLSFACPICSAGNSSEAPTCVRCGVPLGAYRALYTLPERLLERGTRLMQREQYEDALDHILAARLLTPGTNVGLKRHVMCLMHLSHHQRALEVIAAAEDVADDVLQLRAACERAIDERERATGAERAASPASASTAAAEDSTQAPPAAPPQGPATAAAAVAPAAPRRKKAYVNPQQRKRKRK